MSIPQSSSVPNNRIVPFSANSTNSQDGSHTRKIFPNLPKQPSWLANFSCCWISNNTRLAKRKSQQSKVIKLNIKPHVDFSNLFFQEKKRIEREMRSLFNFLTNTDIFAKINLIDKLNFKITSGEITTVDQLKSFFDKAKELAKCIEVYLLKNEYSENFMSKISFDVFEKGFNSSNKDGIKNTFPTFFASNND